MKESVVTVTKIEDCIMNWQSLEILITFRYYMYSVHTLKQDPYGRTI